MGRLTIGMVLAVSLAFAAAGCGGDGGSTTGSALSKEDFISQADAICTSHDTEFASEIQSTFPNADPTSSATSDDDVLAFQEPLSVTTDLRGDQVEELRALTPPEDFEDEWDTILGHLDASVDALAEAAEAAADADREALAEAFQTGQEETDAADEIAQGYGFEVCGQS